MDMDTSNPENFLESEVPQYAAISDEDRTAFKSLQVDTNDFLQGVQLIYKLLPLPKNSGPSDPIEEGKCKKCQCNINTDAISSAPASASTLGNLSALLKISDIKVLEQQRQLKAKEDEIAFLKRKLKETDMIIRNQREERLQLQSLLENARKDKKEMGTWVGEIQFDLARLYSGFLKWKNQLHDITKAPLPNFMIRPILNDTLRTLGKYLTGVYGNGASSHGTIEHPRSKEIQMQGLSNNSGSYSGGHVIMAGGQATPQPPLQIRNEDIQKPSLPTHSEQTIRITKTIHGVMNPMSSCDSFKCVCQQGFTSKSLLTLHIRQEKALGSHEMVYYVTTNVEMRNIFKCAACARSFRFRGSLRSHFRNIHDQPADYTRRIIGCPFCDDRFISAKQLKDHRVNDHGIRNS